MSLETHIAGAEDALISGLHFGNRNTASYITERRSATFAPQTSADITPAGSRLLRFNLSDQSGFLDGSTVRLAFKLNNSGGSAIFPSGTRPFRFLDECVSSPMAARSLRTWKSWPA